MKKFVVILMMCVLATTILAGCGEKKKTTTGDTYTGTDSQVADAAKQDPQADAIKPEDITVGFVFIGPVGDGGWSDSHNEGRLYLEEQLGVKTIFKENVPETQEVETIMRDMIDQGANVIFATSYGYMDYMEAMSADYPDVKFFHCSGYKTTDNMSNYFGRIYEARYLSGIVAGLKTKSNKIGYVGAFPIPEVIRGINAFTLGARSVNPEVEVEVVWTSTWYDPATEKAAAEALLDKDCDIIAQHQDTAGPQQAAEERGVFSIGYHTDMQKSAPKANMTSAVWNWGPYYSEAVKSVMDGTYASSSYWGGLNEGIVGLSPLTEIAPAEAKDLVEQATAEIKEGTFHVFAGPIVDQSGKVVVEEGKVLSDEEMLSMNWFVEGVKGKTE